MLASLLLTWPSLIQPTKFLPPMCAMNLHLGAYGGHKTFAHESFRLNHAKLLALHRSDAFHQQTHFFRWGDAI